MSEFIATFGGKYRHEEHPNFKEAHPEGWLAIEADSLDEAWDKAHKRLGVFFSHVYPADYEKDIRSFPRGELARLAYQHSAQQEGK